MSRTTQVIGLAIFLVVCFAAAAIGGSFTAPVTDSAWYQQLPKPSWNPPNWVFAPVWTVLYTLMGIAAWLVWRRRGLAGARVPLGLFTIQLVLNVGWTALFFGQREVGAAFAEIVLLWLAILATMVAFWRVQRAAGILFVPYLAWVTFAAALNYAIWRG